MTLEGRIKRLEREWDHPAQPAPDAEMEELWASLWTAAGLEESRAKAAALEFLLYCHKMGKAPTFIALMRWCEGNIGGGGDVRTA